MKKEIKAGAVLGYINMITNIFVTLLYIPFMLNLMGQNEYGLYSLVVSVIAYLSVLDMGFGNAMIRFVSRSQAKKDNNENKINGMFLCLYILIGIVAFIIGIIVSNNLGILFNDSLSNSELAKAKILMIILTINVSLSFPLSVFDSYVIANEKYIFIKIISILKTILVPMTMIPLLFLGFKSIAMTLVTSGFNILFHIVMIVYAFKKLNMKISFKIKEYDKKIFKDVIYYSFFIFLNLIVDNVFVNSDKIILGSVSGTIAVSVYAIGSQISNMNTQLSTTISGLFLPRITKMLEEKDADKKISDVFLKVSRIQMYIMMLFLSGFTIFGKQFISIWAGQEYIDAFYIVLLLIGPAIIPLTQNIGISILQAKNKHQFRSMVYIFLAVGNIIISIPLAKVYGGIGAALGSAIVTFLGQIVTMNIYYKKVAKLDILQYWKNMIKFGIKIFVLLMILELIIKSNNFINSSLILLAVCGIIYCVFYAVIAFFDMNNEEKIYIKDIFTKLFKRFKKEKC